MAIPNRWPLATLTHSGNLPLHLATYSFVIRPSINSFASSLDEADVRARIINPDVSLSSRLTALYRR
jgi:hypothetical protein